ncbi:hypothetical protein SDC9_160999 [bioreactor metagenome]|uniref:Uncharacterized protein n=1 Tax=bioreactor metagenome TaxID=1076179 RepID=A0A645FJ65_9ZZZZ
MGQAHHARAVSRGKRRLLEHRAHADETRSGGVVSRPQRKVAAWPCLRRRAADAAVCGGRRRLHRAGLFRAAAGERTHGFRAGRIPDQHRPRGYVQAASVCRRELRHHRASCVQLLYPRGGAALARMLPRPQARRRAACGARQRHQLYL